MTETAPVNEAEVVRARLYLLLGRLLASPPDAKVLDLVRDLDDGGADMPLGTALADLARAARHTTHERAHAEYHALFIGVSRGELVPYASWYLTGFVGERPLMRLRRDMERLGIGRAEDVAEPEDHIAALCEMMSGLISGELAAVSEQEQARFFEAHLARWAPRFFEDLSNAAEAPFYAAVGAVGRRFLELET